MIGGSKRMIAGLNYGSSMNTPRDKYDDIIKLARTNQYVVEGGFFVWAEIADPPNNAARTVTFFLPETDALKLGIVD